MKTLNIFFDNLKHQLTLGGSLVLRQEVELLASIKTVKIIHIYLNKDIDTMEQKVIDIVFKSSNLSFKIFKAYSDMSYDWPLKHDLNNPHFSYHSFLRINKLFYKFNKKPRLNWKKNIVASAQKKVKSIDKGIIAIHLKNVEDDNFLESNVDVQVWTQFFKENKSKDYYFLLIGDDVTPNPIDFDNVLHAKSFDLSIEEQLAYVPLCKGFIGLASGMCTSANFSNIPYVILKHPNHHKEEMDVDLNSKTNFPFCNENQHLWRVPQNKQVLQKAFQTVIN